MTSRKQLKIRVRSRMARAGESYSTALRHVTGSAPVAGPVEEDAGYRLLGGVDPASAGLARVLAYHGVRAGAPVCPSTVRSVSFGRSL